MTAKTQWALANVTAHESESEQVNDKSNFCFRYFISYASCWLNNLNNRLKFRKLCHCESESAKRQNKKNSCSVNNTKNKNIKVITNFACASSKLWSVMVIICCSMSPISLRVSCPFSVPSRPESPPSDRCWEGWWTELSACIPGWPLMPSPRPLEAPLPVRGCCCNIFSDAQWRRLLPNCAHRHAAHPDPRHRTEQGPLAIDRKRYKPCKHTTAYYSGFLWWQRG